MTMFEKIVVVLKVLIGMIVLFVVYKVIRYWVIEWQANRDRSANLFDKAELSISEERLMKKWIFNVTDDIKEYAISNYKTVGHDTYTFLQFCHGMSKE